MKVEEQLNYYYGYPLPEFEPLCLTQEMSVFDDVFKSLPPEIEYAPEPTYQEWQEAFHFELFSNVAETLSVLTNAA